MTSMYINLPISYVENRHGATQIKLHGGATRAFSGRTIWRPTEVAEMVHLMHQRESSVMGFYEAYVTMRTIYQQKGQQMAIDIDTISEIETLKEEQMLSWDPRESTNILATQDFTDMVVAATLSAPNAPLRREDIIAESGTLFFEKPLYLQRFKSMLRPDDPYHAAYDMDHPIRAIHWYPKLNDPAFYGIETLIEGTYVREDIEAYQASAPNAALAPVGFWDHLVAATTGVAQIDATPEEHDKKPSAIKHAIAMLRSAKAILDSPLSTQNTGETQPRKKKSKRSRRAKDIDTSTVRVLSLRRPEYGKYELDAATGHTPKTPQRMHWVRGHWRNQWYPSAQEHRPRWIDGYIKGNADYGDVTDRPTVYLATGDTPPAGRHETPNKLTTTEGRTQ